MRNYKKIILEKDIPLYLYNDPSMKQVFCGYTIKYGSDGRWFDFELDGKKYHVSSGHAHFLEHLLGENSKYGNIYSNFTERHYDANAYTTLDHTTYHFTGYKDTDKSIKELIEAIEKPVFDSKDVEHARKAIVREATTTMDNPRRLALALTKKNLYKSFDMYDDTLSSIGDGNINRNISIDNLKVCYDAFYTDNNKVLVLAGNFDENRIVDYLNKILSNCPKHESRIILPNYDMEPIRKTEDTFDKKVLIDYNTLGIKLKKPDGVSIRDFQFAVDVNNEYILGSGSKFVKQMKSDYKLDSIQSYFFGPFEEYTSYIHSFLSSNPELYYEELLKKLNSKDITKEEFELIKKCFIVDDIRSLDEKYKIPKTFGQMMKYTTDYSQCDFYKSKTYEEFKEILDKIDYNVHTKVKIKH